jgi:ATP-dependent Clp protease ATP-binding subunit ClpA
VRELPYAVLLLDELEKAHPDIINIFLTLIDEGYFTDGFGKRVDCKNLIVIGTSNAGADYIYKQQTIMSKLSAVMETGAEKNQSPSSTGLIDYLIQKHIYSPEFLNRFDGVVTYNAISNDAIIAIARKMSESIQKTILELYNIKVSITDETLLAVIQKKYNPRFGARNLEHIVTAEIEDKIAALLLEKKIAEGAVISL